MLTAPWIDYVLQVGAYIVALFAKLTNAGTRAKNVLLLNKFDSGSGPLLEACQNAGVLAGSISLMDAHAAPRSASLASNQSFTSATGK